MSASQRFVTPEAVILDRELAGLGTRFIAGLVDGVLQVLVLIVAGITSDELSPDGGVILIVLTLFSVIFVYPTAMEVATRGRTVGKLVARIRVVRSDGRPVTFPVVLVRNLLRLVDILPNFYTVGAITILVTRRSQRLGDLAAGTVVVHEAPREAPAPLQIPPSPSLERARRGMDVAGLTPEEYGIVRSFLLRRGDMDPEARTLLASDLRRRLVDRVGSADPEADPETFLEAIAVEYGERGRGW